MRYFGGEDPEVNAATRIPPGEQALMPAIWLAEVFTPTTIDNLVKGMRDLTAKADGSLLDSDADLSEWVLSSRRHGGFAYRAVPYVVPKVGRLLGPNLVDQVPAAIDYIHPALQTLTPTVTVLTVAFRLKDDWARQPTDILNQDFATRARMNSDGGFTLMDVMRQKADAVDEWRAMLRREAANWITERFPGFFCKIAPGQLPTIDLLLTGSYRPWEAAARSDIPEWAKILDLATWSEFWQAKDLGSLRLNQRARANQRHSFTLAAIESELLGPGSIGVSSGELNEAIAILDLSVPFLLGRWSLTALLAELEEQMPSIQDAADRAGRKSSPRALAQVQQQLLRAGLDNRIVVNDIVRYTRDPMWKYSVPDFSEVLPASYGPARKPAPSLADLLRQGQAANGRRVAQMEADLREVLGTNAELAAAGANLRLQRTVIWLTIVSVIVAAVAAFAAVLAVWHPSTASAVHSGETRPTTHHSPPAVHKRPSARR